MGIYLGQEVMEDYHDYLANIFLQYYVLTVSVPISMIILPEISSIELTYWGFWINFNSHAQELIYCIEP